MKAMTFRMSVCFAWVILALCAHAVSQEAVVLIYAYRSDGTSQGTGFLTSDHGRIVTAYHVVQGARKIEVSNESIGSLSNIRVDFISPDYDVAVLQALGSGITPFYKVGDVLPSVADDLEAQGYPLGSPKQVFHVHATRNGALQASQMSGPHGRRIFNQDLKVNIIPLDMTIYTGMSGGPVTRGNRVIGVLSGSYQEGGSIAWAIPSMYVLGQSTSQLQSVMRKPNDMIWPQLTLMSGASKNLRAMVRVNSRAALAYDQFMERVEDLATVCEEVNRQAQATRRDILVQRPFFERVLSDPALRADPEAADELLAGPLQVMSSSFSAFGAVYDETEATSREANVAMSTLFSWVGHEANLDDDAGRELVRKMTQVVDEHMASLERVATYFDLDMSPMQNALPELALARQQGSTRQAAAMLKAMDAAEPIVNAYAAPQALMYISEATSMFRQVGHVFESVVYRDGAK